MLRDVYHSGVCSVYIHYDINPRLAKVFLRFLKKKTNFQTFPS